MGVGAPQLVLMGEGKHGTWVPQGEVGRAVGVVLLRRGSWARTRAAPAWGEWGAVEPRRGPRVSRLRLRGSAPAGAGGRGAAAVERGGAGEAAALARVTGPGRPFLGAGWAGELRSGGVRGAAGWPPVRGPSLRNGGPGWENRGCVEGAPGGAGLG